MMPQDPFCLTILAYWGTTHLWCLGAAGQAQNESMTWVPAGQRLAELQAVVWGGPRQPLQQPEVPLMCEELHPQG